MSEVFRVVESTTLCEAGFLTVERRRVVGPDGAQFDRHVVLHPGAVVVVPVDADGNALLVRQYRVAAGRELLEVPAGKRDVPGEPPEVTASRELEEEVGRRAAVSGCCASSTTRPASPTSTPRSSSRPTSRSASRAAVSAEEAAMTIESVALSRIDDLIASGELVDGKSIIGLLLARTAIAVDGHEG